MAREKGTKKKPRKKSAGASGQRSRRRIRSRGIPTQLAFESIAIEGGLLSPDWLARAAQLEASRQSAADYRIPKGLNLRDEIGRYWRIAQAHWIDLAAGRDAAGDSQDESLALAERFVTAMLRDCFGFGSLTAVGPVEIDERLYPVRHAGLKGRVPVVIAPAGAGLDALSPAFGDGTRRRSAFGLCQEFLNAEDGALWGIVSDGVTLRILRDNASLTRPAWIEADLGRLFAEERYADFTALWLLAHESRFGRADQPVTDCPLEAWREAGREEGTRARELLRHGVEEALAALGQGFLSHPENQGLRAAFASGAITKAVYFQQLLRLVYRVIFLLTVEERGVLHPTDSSEAARKLYADGYGLRRLRERAVRRSAHDRHHDHWETMKISFRGLATGEPRLGLPALAGIFAKDQCPALDAARLENRFLLLALFRLSWLREETGIARVNWRDMGPEELGSVYESLLELVPQVSDGGRSFSFATGGETKGHARKTSGSYYTPDSLVQVLLESALEPVVARTISEHPSDSVEALLSLAIVDPACGSGHFLLAAARRLAGHIARLQAEGTPSAAEYRHSLRQVVGRCIYGVDLNPMAVELCKVSLWMEAVEPGLPLTFLDSHIRHGNALLGTTPALMATGIPDEAWKALEGDDKEVASALRKRNKAERSSNNLQFEFSRSAEGATIAILGQMQALDAAPDTELKALVEKRVAWAALLESDQYLSRQLAADAWCAAFVWPKQAGELAHIAPTQSQWEALRNEPRAAPTRLVARVRELAQDYQFFHWHLAFPQVFARGGFDIVLGNPPWERVNINQKEWFTQREPDVADSRNVAERSRRIADLRENNLELWEDWVGASRKAQGTTHFARASLRYPLCAHGDINSYSLFAELNRSITRASGRVGCVLPSGIATDKSTRQFFASLMEAGSILSLHEFENEGFFSAGKGHMLRFALTTLVGDGNRVAATDFFFQGQSLAELSDSERHFTLTNKDIELVNPNTRTCPIFRTRRDAEITKAIYRRMPVLVLDAAAAAEEEEHAEEHRGSGGGSAWIAGLGRTIHMGDDAGLFHTRQVLEASGGVLRGNVFFVGGVEMQPLYEAKMIFQMDHRYGDFGATGTGEREHRLPRAEVERLNDPCYVPMPYYWVARPEVDARLERRGWRPEWLMGWRDVTDSRASLRTVIAAVFPRTATSDKLPLILASEKPAELLAGISSFVFDYCARQKLGGVSLKQFIFKQLPFPSPGVFDEAVAWDRQTTLSSWIVPRVLELTYNAWDLESFARHVGYDGPPFRWDSERRFLLRAELDAAFFHLYEIERSDVEYIMETFPVVRRRDGKVHGGYRTKEVILGIYDAMAEAVRAGRPYQTSLEPLPAEHDSRIVHAPRVREGIHSGAETASVAAGAWERPGIDHRAESGAALAAVLKAFGTVTPASLVRLAAILVLEPRLLVGSLSSGEGAAWQRAIGASAAPLPEGVTPLVPRADGTWGAAVRHLRGNGMLVEDSTANAWAPGVGLDAIETAGWPDGRARFVVRVLQQREARVVVQTLPGELQRWVDGAAA